MFIVFVCCEEELTPLCSRREFYYIAFCHVCVDVSIRAYIVYIYAIIYLYMFKIITLLVHIYAVYVILLF